MINKSMKLVLVSTPIGYIGSGKGGGVELTFSSLVKGLLALGHEVKIIAPLGSILPSGCSSAQIKYLSGDDQPSWQHQKKTAPVVIPPDGVLPRLLEEALSLGENADAVLNFSYDWLPIWLTPRVNARIFHLISMGAVSDVMKSLIGKISKENHQRFAFHTYRQASDYELFKEPIVVGNGFNLESYNFNSGCGGPLGWAGRIAPEKGLEDAVKVAADLNERLVVWGLCEDQNYAEKIEKMASPGLIDWRGFLSTEQFQKELGECRAFLNTPKWNEAYGNVVVEAMACGVPVISYDRGGPGELIQPGVTGWLVPPDDLDAMKKAVSKISEINRTDCRAWVEKSASQDLFAKKIVNWIQNGLRLNDETFE